ncbi:MULTISPECIES: phosphotransferase family protein [unclassified Facklamia]|uniref:phosphotransferase family protein n=1 Tax=Aerococcaceae TaxID=186827 RepID=UPI0013BACF1C|nr:MULTISPECIES: phosphotransferase family protein [unclassified Facklamia]MBS4461357.1 phosphotransferase family protein [Aerococcaceae bacterium zg-B36]NEW64169.1 phosphotransferase [Facklamia sp. 252]NEW67626.1 phosphotransferase [Facklamia sp. 253]QQD65874.1 phosphotransferase family protein [Aerococcaceae bacterium zg-252]
MAFDGRNEWQMYPLSGGSGEAFMGVRNNEKVFFKRNSSPFIPSLSAEGLAPKLMWTQRTYSGDLLTAQEWKNATQLTKQHMNDERVIQLIRHIHQSDHLLMLLRRVQNEAFIPIDFIDRYFDNLPPSLYSHQFFNQVIRSLEDMVDDDFYHCRYAVCHGDLNHNNFMIDDSREIFLVDWEEVKIADPISDITWLLLQYYQPSEWMNWFELYDFEIDETFYKRVKWYSLMNCLLLIKQFSIENRPQQMNHYILLLKKIYDAEDLSKEETHATEK